MRRRLLLLTLAPASALAVLGASAAASGALLVNESPSLPEGLYQRTGPTLPGVGDVVALDPPAGARAYLSGLGMPASAKLLKRVAATGGRTVCAGSGVIRLEGRELRARARDRRGVALPRWTGCRTLAPDEIFVLGDSADSFDSRYFGPVRHRAVAGIYREIVTW
jgi:conjugative transfer signal peptidase TraF